MSPPQPLQGWPRRRALSAGLAAAGLLATAAGCANETAVAEEQPDPRDKSRRWAKTTVADMALPDKVAQLFVTYVYGQTADTTDPDDVSRNQKWLGVDNAKQLFDKFALGGIIYFGWTDNLAEPRKTAQLSNELQDTALAVGSKVPLLISTDQEQGVIVRVGPPATQFPGNMALGAGRDRGNAKRAAEITGAELRALGINQDFAPDADVNVNPANPVIGVRSFGEDPDLVAKLTSSQVAGYQSGKDAVAAAAKHFPGHGDTGTDSHTDLPVINHTRQQWEELDAPPFAAAIKADIDVIMTAHIQFPALDDTGDPATLSKPILTGLLREELGFDGMVITDSLSMEGVRKLYPDDVVVVKALQAGVDMLLMPPKLELAINAVLDAVESGDLKESRIDEAVTRILEVKHLRGIVDDPHVDPDAVDSIVGTKKHLKDAARITETTTTLIKNDAELLPLPVDTGTVLVTGAGYTATLAKAIAAQGPGTSEFDTGTDPDAGVIAEAVNRAGDADAVVVVTRETVRHSAQAELVEALRGSKTPVAVVSVKEPYDLNRFPEVDTYLATYSYTEPALVAAAKVLCGVVNPVGKLPVTIPSADDPDTPLFEFGHGLGY